MKSFPLQIIVCLVGASSTDTAGIIWTHLLTEHAEMVTENEKVTIAFTDIPSFHWIDLQTSSEVIISSSSEVISSSSEVLIQSSSNVAQHSILSIIVTSTTTESKLIDCISITLHLYLIASMLTSSFGRESHTTIESESISNPLGTSEYGVMLYDWMGQESND